MAEIGDTYIAEFSDTYRILEFGMCLRIPI